MLEAHGLTPEAWLEELLSKRFVKIKRSLSLLADFLVPANRLPSGAPCYCNDHVVATHTGFSHGVTPFDEKNLNVEMPVRISNTGVSMNTALTVGHMRAPKKELPTIPIAQITVQEKEQRTAG